MNQQHDELSIMLDYIDASPKLFSKAEGTFRLFGGREFQVWRGERIWRVDVRSLARRHGRQRRCLCNEQGGRREGQFARFWRSPLQAPRRRPPL